MDEQLLSQAQIMTISWTLTFTVQFIFFTISTLTYWRTRQKVFLNYALYLALIMIYLITRLEVGQIDGLWNYALKMYVARYAQIIAFVAYVHFLLDFLQVGANSARTQRITISTNKGIILLGTMVLMYCVFNSDPGLMNTYYHVVHGPLALGLIVFLYFGTLHIKSKDRYFFVYGNLVFFLSVIIASLLSFRPVDGSSLFLRAPLFIFYIGLVLQMIIFSIGLAYQIEKAYQEKLATQQKLMQLEADQSIRLQAELVAKEEELNAMFSLRQEEQARALKKDYEDELTRMEIEVLRAQMNPHLLFNSLNTLKHFILKEQKINAVEYLGRLASYMRKILQMTSVKEISVQQEVDFLRLYVEMENMRFDQDVEFHITNFTQHMPEDIKIAPMILQPMVENAFHHGLVRKDGEKRIDIELHERENVLHILIRDNGIGRAASKEAMSPTHKRDSRGLQMARHRMQLALGQDLTPEDYVSIRDLYDDEGSSAGTEVTLRFPKKPHQGGRP